MRKRIYAWFMTLVLSITSISSTSIIYADDFSDETEVMTEDEGTEEEDITDDSEIDFDSEEDASINEEQIEEDESEESQDEVTIEQEISEEEEAEDPRAELVEQLLEYKMYKCISYELKDRQMDSEKVMFKEPTIPDEVAAYEEPVDLEELMADVTLKKLNDIFKSIMRKQEDKIDPVRSKFGKIEKEEVSLSDKMGYL